MIRIASKIAAKSKFKRARVGACIVKSGRVLAVGYNRIGYSKHFRDKKYPHSIHAEEQAILQLLKENRLDDLANSTIYVSRLGRAGSTRMARPCSACSLLIRSMGIGKVVYTTNNGVESYDV